MHIFTNLDEFTEHVGQSLGATDYLYISQGMVNQFAEATGDHQWIHTDSERAIRESPYASTIAHGYLTLSLAPKLMAQLYRIKSVKMAINYGANRIRFTQAVPVGSRLRLRAQLQSIEPQNHGFRATMECIFDLENNPKPVCVAELITLFFE